jgi:hypothetical protein
MVTPRRPGHLDDDDLREVPRGFDGLGAWLATVISSGWGKHPDSRTRCVRIQVLGREKHVVNVIAEIQI